MLFAHRFQRLDRRDHQETRARSLEDIGPEPPVEAIEVLLV
jgi:hypothetical protein